MFERWHWDLVHSVDPMEFEDFIALADVVQLLNDRDQKAYEESRKRK